MSEGAPQKEHAEKQTPQDDTLSPVAQQSSHGGSSCGDAPAKEDKDAAKGPVAAVVPKPTTVADADAAETGQAGMAAGGATADSGARACIDTTASDEEADIDGGAGAASRSFRPFGLGSGDDADEWGEFSPKHFAIGFTSGLLLNFFSFFLRCMPVGKGPSFHNGNIVGIIASTLVVVILLIVNLIPLPTRETVAAPAG